MARFKTFKSLALEKKNRRHVNQKERPDEIQRIFFMRLGLGPSYFQSKWRGIGPLLRSPDWLSSQAWASAPTERDKTKSPRQSGGGNPNSAKTTAVAPSMFMGIFRPLRFASIASTVRPMAAKRPETCPAVAAASTRFNNFGARGSTG